MQTPASGAAFIGFTIETSGIWSLATYIVERLESSPLTIPQTKPSESTTVRQRAVMEKNHGQF